MTYDTPVLIAGGGPVGMTLALELARHGVRSLLVERNPGTTQHPKMDLTNGRSMELYRRLGVAAALRAAGVPQDNPFDVMWASSPSGHLLHNFTYPSARAAAQATLEANDGTGTAEPPMRISQIILEPVLREAIEQSPLIEARFGWKFDSLEQDADGVTATLIEEATGQSRTVRAQYLAGCDGGGSRVRRALGIGLDGEDRVNALIRNAMAEVGIDVSGVAEPARVMMIHFRSDDRAILNPWGIAWHLQTPVGSLVAQDDRNTWTLHIVLQPGTDETNLDPAEMLRAFVGRDFDFEILIANPWTPRLVIANQYRSGRVLLAGDAAHQVIPSGGYGMNTGVGDAVDLGWKLAAVLNGWGGDALLDSYEWERTRIAEQNRTASESHFAVRMGISGAFMRSMADGDLDEPGEAGNARRARLGADLAALGNAENECWGIEHGYAYFGSPAVAAEQEAPPVFDPLRCIPSTYPGSRLPHIVLSDGTFLIDHLGSEFTLIARGGADIGDFAAQADDLGVPLKVLHLAEEPPLEQLECKLILVRPDQHIAWRSDAPVASRPIWERAVQLVPPASFQSSDTLEMAK